MALSIQRASAFASTWPAKNDHQVREHVRMTATFAGNSEEEEKLARQRLNYARNLSQHGDVTRAKHTVEELVDPRLAKLDDLQLMDGWDTPSPPSSQRPSVQPSMQRSSVQPSMQRGSVQPEADDEERRRRHERSSIICDADARREEGTRRLRRADFLGAAQILEAAWDLVENEFPRAFLNSPRKLIDSARDNARESVRGAAGERRTPKSASGRQSRQACKTPLSDRSTPMLTLPDLPAPDLPAEASQADGTVKMGSHSDATLKQATHADSAAKLSEQLLRKGVETAGAPREAQNADDEDDILDERRYALGNSKMVHKKRAASACGSGTSGGSPLGSVDSELVDAEGDLQRAIIEAASTRVAAGSRLPSLSGPTEETAALPEQIDLQRELKSRVEAQIPASPAQGEQDWKDRRGAISSTEKNVKLPILMDLSLAFLRLQDWARLDVITEMGLELCADVKPATLGPDLHSSCDEETWIAFMIRRGVACAFLGTDNFQRGESYFEAVLKIQPKNRDAKRGLSCMKFLRAQLPLGGAAYEQALAAMAAVT